LREGIFVIIADEIPAVLAQNIQNPGVRIPAECAPDELVDIVVAAFRVGEEADCIGLHPVKNRGFIHRTRIDHLAGLRDRVCYIPIGHWILRLQAVRDIRIMPDRISLRYFSAQLRQTDPHLRSKYYAR